MGNQVRAVPEGKIRALPEESARAGHVIGGSGRVRQDEGIAEDDGVEGDAGAETFDRLTRQVEKAEREEKEGKKNSVHMDGKFHESEARRVGRGAVGVRRPGEFMEGGGESEGSEVDFVGSV